MNKYFYIAGLLFLAFSFELKANEWVLYKSFSSENINIYYRVPSEEPSLVEFRGETIVQSNLTKLVAVIRDVELMHEWVYQVKSAKTDELVSDTERYTHIVHDAPIWGLKARDSYVYSSVKQDPVTLEVTFTGKSAPDHKGVDARYERIKKGRSYWKFIPLDSEHTKAIFQGYGDPGGYIEKVMFSFLVKQFLWRLPYETLRDLKKQVGKERYKNIRFSFIQDLK
ncbi:MAG: START domain-containing protein [Gammaproteobacteria bacterium]|nr:START domain-containing protein [Gammaproteobacteria bacterium]